MTRLPAATRPDAAGPAAPRPDAPPLPSPGFVLALAAAASAVALALYWPTLRASYAYDDIDYLNDAADVLAGRAGWLEIALSPYHEHVAPLLRVAFQASALLFGVRALPLRLLVLGAHVGSAVLLGLVGRRYARHDAASFAIAIAYVLPAGFASLPVWLAGSSGVTLGLLGANAALCAIAWQERLGRRRAVGLAGLGLLVLAAADSVLLLLAAGPVLLDALERRRHGDRRLLSRFALAAILLAAAWAALAAVLYGQRHGETFDLYFAGAIGRGAFLLGVAPYRLVFPGAPLVEAGASQLRVLATGVLYGLAIAAAALTALAALLSGERSPLLRVATVAATGPIGFVALVCLARATYSYRELYGSDGYFLPLVTPIVLVVGAAADALAGRLPTWPARRRAAVLAAIAALVIAELAANVLALRRRVPLWIFAAHERRFAQLERLARRLEAAGARAVALDGAPLELPDGAVAFPDVHNNRISTRTLLHMIGGGETPGLRLGPHAVQPRDEALLNPVLEAWAGEIGEPLPYLFVQAGELVNAREAGFADFRQRSHAEKVVAGFGDHERASRWMGRHGELRLALAGPRLELLLHLPLEQIQRRVPGWGPFTLRASLVDDESGDPVELGAITIAQGGIQDYELAVPPSVYERQRGRQVRLLLDASDTFETGVVFPGTGPGREVAVEVFRAGFGP